MLEILATFILITILIVLWTIDLSETVGFVDKMGVSSERNPFARFLLKHGDYDFVAFKLVDLIFLIFILNYIRSANIFMANALLFVFIMIYTVTVVHNYVVIKEEENDEKKQVTEKTIRFKFDYMPKNTYASKPDYSNPIDLKKIV